MKFFIHHHPPSGLKALEAAQVLIAEYETRNKWLEIENMRLIGLAYPLNSSPKTGEEVMTHEDQLRVIDLADAAGRAMSNGLLGLSAKLAAEAENLLLQGSGQSFLAYGERRGLNMDLLLPPGRTVNGEHRRYESEKTQELFDCWLAARGQKVWTPPTDGATPVK